MPHHYAFIHQMIFEAAERQRTPIKVVKKKAPSCQLPVISIEMLEHPFAAFFAFATKCNEK